MIDNAVLSPDGPCVVSACSDNTARLWDAVTGRPLAAVEGHTDWVTSAAFWRDGTRVLTA
jgi:WD40 repeat protein